MHGPQEQAFIFFILSPGHSQPHDHITQHGGGSIIFCPLQGSQDKNEEDQKEHFGMKVERKGSEKKLQIKKRGKYR